MVAEAMVTDSTAAEGVVAEATVAEGVVAEATVANKAWLLKRRWPGGRRVVAEAMVTDSTLAEGVAAEAGGRRGCCSREANVAAWDGSVWDTFKTQLCL